MSGAVILTVSHAYAVSAERVFDAWLDPAIVPHFLFATPDGAMIRCEIDAQVGGRALIVERRPGGDAHHRLKYEAIERPTRLVFLFSADPAEEGEWTRVTVAIVPNGSGCTLTLTHEMDPQWAAYEAQTRSGWTMILDSLGRMMETKHD